MTLALQAFTNPTNTSVIADTAAPPGSLPTAPVFTTAQTPLINGNDSYIWSPFTASGQTVTFRSVFNVTGLPVLTLALPVSVFYAFAGNETVSVTGTLEVVNVLGIVVLSVPLFTGVTNAGNPENVATASGDALLALAILTGNSIRITVDATVTAPVTLPYSPANTGTYLGEITVNTII